MCVCVSVVPCRLRNAQAEEADKEFKYKRQLYAGLGEGWSWNNGREVASEHNMPGIVGIPKARSEEELIPRIAHFIISDSSKRYFDWTCYLAVMAARRHVKPTTIMMHVLEGAAPKGGSTLRPHIHISQSEPFPQTLQIPTLIQCHS